MVMSVITTIKASVTRDTRRRLIAKRMKMPRQNSSAARATAATSKSHCGTMPDRLSAVR